MDPMSASIYLHNPQKVKKEEALQQEYENIRKKYHDLLIKSGFGYSDQDSSVHLKRLENLLEKPAYFFIDKFELQFADILFPIKTAVKPVCYEAVYSGPPVQEKSHMHGNHVRLSGLHFICAQVPSFVRDDGFWRQAFKREYIIDLTNPADNLCGVNYPEEGRTLTTRSGKFKVACLSKIAHPTKPEVFISKYAVTMGNETKEVTRYNDQRWPDHSLPQNLNILEDIVTTALEHSFSIIHCLAGTGRTMTTAIAAALIQGISDGKITKDNYRQMLDSLILSAREQRGEYALTNLAQYEGLINLAEKKLSLI